jgi:serine protease inhibitor
MDISGTGRGDETSVVQNSIDISEGNNAYIFDIESKLSKKPARTKQQTEVSETSVNFYQVTRRHIEEEVRENLKSNNNYQLLKESHEVH